MYACIYLSQATLGDVIWHYRVMAGFGSELLGLQVDPVSVQLSRSGQFRPHIMKWKLASDNFAECELKNDFSIKSSIRK